MLVMRVLMILAVALLMVACGPYSFPASPTPTPSTGTVTGRVIAFPCAPVQTVPNNCAGRPVAGLQIVYQNGSVTNSTTTDSNGGYSTQLTPGTWKVHLSTYMRLVSGPTLVTVAAGSTVSASYVLDSGIRVPVPQA